VVSNLTLYPPKVLFFNIRYLLLSVVNSKQKKINNWLPLSFSRLMNSHSPPETFTRSSIQPSLDQMMVSSSHRNSHLISSPHWNSHTISSPNPDRNQGMFAKRIWEFHFYMNRLMGVSLLSPFCCPDFSLCCSDCLCFES
jgi:hypothetical protein